MMRFNTLLRHPADWMESSSADCSIVLTSRVRLARNLRNEPFPGWARKQDRIKILEQIRPEVESLKGMKNCFAKQLSELDSVEKQVLVERHLISREQAARSEGSATVINRKQTLSLMVNEEDHLRIQAMRPGLNLAEAYKLINGIDDQLEKSLPFAYDDKLGYLTACPTNLGTGMRASAMLHLPGLVLSDQISQVISAVNKIGLAVRGLYGEGTESLGNLFQISNQTTLGESEESIITRLERVISQVAKHEENARLKLLEDDPNMIRDRIGRAYGTLRHSHIIASKEALNLLSMIRLGADLRFFTEASRASCDALFMEIQPAHLQLEAKRKLPTEERDQVRAEIIRDRLQSLEAPAISNQSKPDDSSGSSTSNE